MKRMMKQKVKHVRSEKKKWPEFYLPYVRGEGS
jgi:hypothetical protein